MRRPHHLSRMHVGLVDLDTSHPEAWLPLLRSRGHVVQGVYDGGSIHPPHYVRSFAERHNIPRVYDSLDELAEDCDLGMICSCNWDTHCEKAEPFIRRQRAVFIDKPIAGNRDDLEQIIGWSDHGARISGGSALRYCQEVENYLARPLDERGIPQTVMVTCGWDAFNYGIHAYALLIALMGDRVESVEHLDHAPQLRVRVNFEGGRCGFIIIGATGQPLPFVATIATPCAVEILCIDNQHLYRNTLETVLPYLSGAVDSPPIPIRSLVIPERCAIAARQSQTCGDVTVLQSGGSTLTSTYDGSAFAQTYRQAKYPSSSAAESIDFNLS